MHKLYILLTLETLITEVWIQWKQQRHVSHDELKEQQQLMVNLYGDFNKKLPIIFQIQVMCGLD